MMDVLGMIFDYLKVSKVMKLRLVSRQFAIAVKKYLIINPRPRMEQFDKLLTDIGIDNHWIGYNKIIEKRNWSGFRYSRCVVCFSSTKHGLHCVFNNDCTFVLRIIKLLYIDPSFRDAKIITFVNKRFNVCQFSTICSRCIPAITDYSNVLRITKAMFDRYNMPQFPLLSEKLFNYILKKLQKHH